MYAFETSGHPEMEREQSAFDGEPDRQDRGRNRQHRKCIRIRRQLPDHLLNRDHEQMSAQVVEKHDSQKEQTGSQKIQDHIADRGQRGASYFTHDEEAAAGQSQYFQKDITGEKVIGPDHRKERRRHQVQKRVIEIFLA